MTPPLAIGYDLPTLPFAMVAVAFALAITAFVVWLNREPGGCAPPRTKAIVGLLVATAALLTGVAIDP